MGLGTVGIPAASTHAQPASPPVPSSPRGIVFLVSDGMSPGVFTMAQSFSRFARGRDTAWWSFYNRPTTVRGLMDTASANSLVTDSAAASSAWGSGKRVHNGSINVAPDGTPQTPIAALLKMQNPRTKIGLVTTATVTHATPAGFAANSAHRQAEQEIAPQYLDRVDVILGGGADFFSSTPSKGGLALRSQFQNAGYGTPVDRVALLASRAEKLLGTFSPSHLPYSMDRIYDAATQRAVPTLEEMSVAALSRFLASGDPFLLQIEGARIDHAAHLNDIGALLHEQIAFDDALAAVIRLTAPHPDVLVIATSDHGNSNPGLNGIGEGYRDSTSCFRRILRIRTSHERIFAEWNGLGTKSPETLQDLVSKHMGIGMTPAESEALAMAIGHGRIIEWNHLHENAEGLLGQICGNHTGIGWTGTTHTSDPTIVTAHGPGAERFHGVVHNTDVFRHLSELLG
jgi:alkaline phosphatase